MEGFPPGSSRRDHNYQLERHSQMRRDVSAVGVLTPPWRRQNSDGGKAEGGCMLGELADQSSVRRGEPGGAVCLNHAPLFS